MDNTGYLVFGFIMSAMLAMCAWVVWYGARIESTDSRTSSHGTSQPGAGKSYQKAEGSNGAGGSQDGYASNDDYHRRSHHSPNISKDVAYGRILGLKGKVTRADVKRAYRDLAMQYHPDKVNHLGPKLREVAEREFKDINAAYEYFRAKYDI